MKKILTGIFAFVFAAVTVFAVNAAESNQSFDPSYHWFDAHNNYLGFLTESSQRVICDATTTIDCRKGYTEVDFDEDGNEIPDGTLMVSLKKTN